MVLVHAIGVRIPASEPIKNRHYAGFLFIQNKNCYIPLLSFYILPTHHIANVTKPHNTNPQITSIIETFTDQFFNTANAVKS